MIQSPLNKVTYCNYLILCIQSKGPFKYIKKIVKIQARGKKLNSFQKITTRVAADPVSHIAHQKQPLETQSAAKANNQLRSVKTCLKLHKQGLPTAQEKPAYYTACRPHLLYVTATNKQEYIRQKKKRIIYIITCSKTLVCLDTFGMYILVIVK